ncbi:hypothetical protein AB0F17_47020 [Nonomuraea sp. NPDC026600]|uniref:hypothetical protein n=1 Tax=Nonomuraea sp. NPDC026600 TaxID=3155363 RepID=UPI0033DE4534
MVVTPGPRPHVVVTGVFPGTTTRARAANTISVMTPKFFPLLRAMAILQAAL